MKSLLAQCTLAAAVAAGVSASLSVSMSMAQDTRPGIGAQIEALGLDRAEIRAKLDGLSREERIAYLQTLGVRLPEGVARLEPGTLPGTALKAIPAGTPDAAVLPADGKFTIMPWTGTIDGAAGTVSAIPLPADGTFTILPWKGPIDGAPVTVQPLPVRPGSVANTGSVVIDPAAVSGPAFTPAQLPAKP